MTYEYFGYPADFLQKTKQNVEKVTKADVLRVAREHLKPDKMQILAVGRPQDFDEPLSVLGPMREIDITIPVPQK
jgi:zinc protease